MDIGNQRFDVRQVPSPSVGDRVFQQLVAAIEGPAHTCCGYRRRVSTRDWRLTGQDQQRPEARWFPEALELRCVHGPRRSQGRVVNDQVVGRRADDHDVVKPILSIREQDDDRLALAHARPELIDRSGNAQRLPAARADGICQHVVGNATRPPVDERRELLNVRVRVSPVAEHHRDRRAAAQRVGLREVRDLQRQRRRQRQRGEDSSDHSAT